MGYKDPETQRKAVREWLARRRREWLAAHLCGCGSPSTRLWNLSSKPIPKSPFSASPDRWDEILKDVEPVCPSCWAERRKAGRTSGPSRPITGRVPQARPLTEVGGELVLREARAQFVRQIAAVDRQLDMARYAVDVLQAQRDALTQIVEGLDVALPAEVDPEPVFDLDPEPDLDPEIEAYLQDQTPPPDPDPPVEVETPEIPDPPAAVETPEPDPEPEPLVEVAPSPAPPPPKPRAKRAPRAVKAAAPRAEKAEPEEKPKPATILPPRVHRALVPGTWEEQHEIETRRAERKAARDARRAAWH